MLRMSSYMEKILRNINSSPQKTRVLTWTSTACAITVALFFGVQLALHLLAGEYVTAATVAATAAIGYITVISRVAPFPVVMHTPPSS